jgi:hypothetical protein
MTKYCWALVIAGGIILSCCTGCNAGEPDHPAAAESACVQTRAPADEHCP